MIPISLGMPATGTYQCTGLTGMASASFACTYNLTAKTILIEN